MRFRPQKRESDSKACKTGAQSWADGLKDCSAKFSELLSGLQHHLAAIATLQSALSISDEGRTLILAQPSIHLTAVATAGATEDGSHGLRVTSLIEERSIGMDFDRTLSALLSKIILYSRSSLKGARFKNGHVLS